MSPKIGVIAEDKTDADVIRVVLQRSKGTSIAVKPRAQKGCSKIKAKAARIIADLIAKDSVSHIIVIHDLDRNPNTSELNDEDELRSILEKCCGGGTPEVRRLICIPVEELEAWFWSDPAVVEKIGKGKGKALSEPHRLPRPKEALVRLSLAANGRPRYSTQDNPALAGILDLSLCASRCRSFRELLAFLE